MSAPLTATELADALGVTVATVNGWAKSGQIPCSEVGRTRWFFLNEVLAATRKPARPVNVHRPLAAQDDEFTELRQWLAARRERRTPATNKKARRA